MIKNELLYLQDICRSLTRFKELSKLSEIDDAVRELSKSKSVKKFINSRTLEYLYFYFKERVPDWEEYAYDEFNELKQKDEEEIRKLLAVETKDWLITWGDVLRFPGLVDIASEEELVNYISETIVGDREYSCYETMIYENYMNILYLALIELMISVNIEEIGMWNYEDGISEYIVFRSAKVLEEYLDGDLKALEEAVSGKHEHYSFRGKIKEFSDDVRLFLMLR